MYDRTNPDHVTLLRSTILADPTLSFAFDESDSHPLQYLNQVSSQYLVSLGSLSRDAFISLWFPIIETLRTWSDAEVKEKWLFRLQYLLFPKDEITVSGSAFGFFVQEMIKDGLIDSAMADVLTKRPGSLAESLFGSGTLITASDIDHMRTSTQ